MKLFLLAHFLSLRVYILDRTTAKESNMKYLITLFFVAQLALYIDKAWAQPLNYNDSPLNYKNSELNYNNSPMNYQNSPLNYQNSPLNYNATNGVYDNNGNRVGYETKSSEGVRNYFDNNGNRVGYSPSK